MKKRREFVAVNYECLASENDVSLRFNGETSGQTLDLIRSPSGIFAVLSDMPDQLDLRGAGLVGRIGWLYLGFGRDERFHRIGVFVGTLNHSDLDRDMRSLIADSLITYTHFQPREEIVVTRDGVADEGNIFHGIVWMPGEDSKGIHVTLEVDDPLEAKAEVKRRFGPDVLCSLYNERAASKPRN